jgi:hypothetical protein
VSPVHGLTLVALGVVAVIIAIWVVGLLAGFVWGVIKVVVLIGLVAALLWFFFGRSRSS